MESAFTFIALFSLILLANTVDGRPDPALEAVMEDGSMPRAVVEDRRPRPEIIEGLLRKGTSVIRVIPNKNIDCHTSGEAKRDEKPFVKDFEPRPNVSAHDDENLTKMKLSTNDFEPSPSVTGYNNDVLHPEDDKEAFVRDFEPRPSATGYNNDVLHPEDDKEAFLRDFEPRPSATGYNNDVLHPEDDKEAFVRDFEPSPSVTGYNNEVLHPEEDKEAFVRGQE